jgi:hypothetical protein
MGSSSKITRKADPQIGRKKERKVGKKEWQQKR